MSDVKIDLDAEMAAVLIRARQSKVWIDLDDDDRLKMVAQLLESRGLVRIDVSRNQFKAIDTKASP